MVVIPGTEGDVGVLPGHSLLIAAVRPGVIDIHEGGQVRESIFVAGGFAEVSPERCTVLAEEAVPVADIDRAEAEKRLEDAKQALTKAGEVEDGDEIILFQKGNHLPEVETRRGIAVEYHQRRVSTVPKGPVEDPDSTALVVGSRRGPLEVLSGAVPCLGERGIEGETGLGVE